MTYRDWRNADPDWNEPDLLREIEERRNDTEFMQRIADSMEENREILEKLAALGADDE